MAAPEEEGEAKPAEEAKPKSKKKLIIIIAVVVLLLGGGAAAFLLKGGKKAENPEGEGAEEHKAEVHYQLAKLDTFIVNLSEASAFVKVTMRIEYDPSILAAAEAAQHGEGHGGGGTSGGGEGGGGGLPPLLKDREPMIKDAIIRVLASKRSAEVLTNEGKEKLKEELVEAINEAIGLEQPAVVNVYFEEFIIQ